MNEEAHPEAEPFPPPSRVIAPDPAPVRASARQARKARTLRRAGRREACFELLSAGYGHTEIARRLKVSVASVRRDVARAVDQRRLDAPERYIHFQVDRLTRALRSMDDLVERGDTRAVAPYIRLVGALDRYHGLDARYRREPSFPEPLEFSTAPLALSGPTQILASVAERDTQVIENTRS